MTDERSDDKHLRQAFGISILKPSHPRLRQLKLQHQPSVQGYKMWNSTWLLLEFLNSRMSPKTFVLDAGCGWGLAGIWCRSHGARVTATDVDPQVFPYLQLHAEINQVELETMQLAFDEIPDPLLAKTNLLIGADICFRQSMVDPVYRLFERAVGAGVERIVFADPGRPSFETLVSRCAESLEASAVEAEAPEPLVDWPGSGLKVRGRLLCRGF